MTCTFLSGFMIGLNSLKANFHLMVLKCLAPPASIKEAKPMKLESILIK